MYCQQLQIFLFGLMKHSKHHPHSSSSKPTNQIGQLIADKFTALEPNQLITRYVKNGNVSLNQISKQQGDKDSYDHRFNTLQEDYTRKIQKGQKVSSANVRLRKTIKKFSEANLRKETETKIQVSEVQLMNEEMVVQAANIMLGRKSAPFTRNFSSKETKKLKKINKNSLQGCLEQTSNTRKQMLIKSSKVRRSSQSAKPIKQTLRQDSLLIDTTNSTLSNSIMEQTIRLEEKKYGQYQRISKAIEKNGFAKTMEIQKRSASSKAFGALWKFRADNKTTSDKKKFQEQTKNVKLGLKTINQGEINSNLSFDQFFSIPARCKLEGSKKYQQKFTEDILRIEENQ